MNLNITLQRKRRRALLFLVTAVLCLTYGGIAVLFGLLFLLQFDPPFLPWWVGCLVAGVLLCILGVLLLRGFQCLQASLMPSYTPERVGAVACSLVFERGTVDAEPGAVFHKDDSLLLDPEQKTSSADIERESRSEKVGKAHAGAFKIYVVEPRHFLEERSEPGFPRGGLLVFPYEQGWWQHSLQQITLSEILIDDTDVEIYDWEEQKLILTEQASRRLRAGPAYWGPLLVCGFLFVVTLQGERLSGGVILPLISPRLPRCPVLYASSEGDREVLFLFPPAFVPWLSGRKALMKSINVEAIRSHFLALYKLAVKRRRSEG